ncbi:hypothetical protein M0811_09476 [Anaeramoeba ignava]|uniref:Rho GTPase n=1 Tax=Anaeramoeba ignava TaxID=1746090 RepID=A0A9Q0RBJ3_ANAIG|nr:hypothetical protein M0811_09476 [Anaeramoeba ignava]
MKTIKCVVIGDSQVGKTSFIFSYETNAFPGEYIPTVYEPNVNIVHYEDQEIQIGFWDTTGKEEYDKLRPLAYPQTDVFLVFFSLVSLSSFESVKTKWIPEIIQFSQNVPFILVGTKLDLKEDEQTIQKLDQKGLSPIDFDSAQKLAKEINAYEYLECSSLTQKNLKEVVYEAIKAVIDPDKKNQSKKCLIF